MPGRHRPLIETAVAAGLPRNHSGDRACYHGLPGFVPLGPRPAVSTALHAGKEIGVVDDNTERTGRRASCQGRRLPASCVHQDEHVAGSGDVLPKDTLERRHSRSYAPGLQVLAGGAVKVDLLNNNNSQYYGDFTVGDPPQRFTAVFDTGSAVTWVPGGRCHDRVCKEHSTFVVGSSRSFEPAAAASWHSKDGGAGDHAGAGALGSTDGAKEGSGSIHYGTGEVRYEAGKDTLRLCDSATDAGCHGQRARALTVPSQPIGASTSQSDYPFRALPFDGILGLAPSANKGSLLHQLREVRALDKNMLGVYLSEDTHRSGSMDFGGIDLVHVARGEPLGWHPTTSSTDWQVGLKDVLVDGKPMGLCDDRPGGVCPALVDTGSSLVTGPAKGIQPLLEKIHTDDQCRNLANMPTISLRIATENGGVADYPLKPEEYTLRTLEEVPDNSSNGFLREFPILGGGGAKAPEVRSRCDPGIGVMETSGDKWVIGDTFLRRYYSIFDDDHSRVGLVRSVHPNEAPTGGDVVGGGHVTSSGRLVQRGVGAAVLSAHGAVPPPPLPRLPASTSCQRPKLCWSRRPGQRPTGRRTRQLAGFL